HAWVRRIVRAHRATNQTAANWLTVTVVAVEIPVLVGRDARSVNAQTCAVVLVLEMTPVRRRWRTGARAVFAPSSHAERDLCPVDVDKPAAGHGVAGRGARHAFGGHNRE